MTTTQSLVRQCLLATMERGRWYSIEELDELAQQTIIPDQDDLDEVPSGELRWRRQVKNAVRDFRRDGSVVEWNGERTTNSSRYRLPDDSQMGASPSIEPSEVVPVENDPAPRPPVTNDGYGAECFVQNQLESEGWTVFNVRNRGLGYDLYATRATEIRRIEVKSTTNGEVIPELTQGEMDAAIEYGEGFYLATVDNWNGISGELTLFQNPANNMTSRAIVRTVYRLQREGEPED